MILKYVPVLLKRVHIMNVSAIVMAAGLSRRMNRNKLKMKINDKYIFEYILDTIKNCDSCFNEVIVVAKDDDVLKKSGDRGYKCVKNEMSHMGQSVSVKLGIENSGMADGYMFFVADQPFIKRSTIKRLLEEFEKNPDSIVVACYNGIIGNPVIFPRIFREHLLKLEGDTGGRIIIKNSPDKTIKVHIQSDDEFMDIDTMEDYVVAAEKKVSE